MTVLLLITGIALLAGGGDLLVRGAVGAAEALGVSPLLVGLTIVGFGTSTPELVTSIIAAVEEAPGIAVGNAVGSNIANILLILGLSALIAPLAVRPSALRRDGLALVVSTLACLAAVLSGTLGRPVGVGFLLLLIAYLVHAYRDERRAAGALSATHEHGAPAAGQRPRGLGPMLGLAALGIAATVIGARLLVEAAIDLARASGVGETVIGLTVVAVGTSLPELMACVVAALRRHADVAIGNVIGSNIFNMLAILGLTAIVHPITVPPEIARFDIWVMLAATMLLILFSRTGWLLRRWEGGIFLLGYAGYVACLVLNA